MDYCSSDLITLEHAKQRMLSQAVPVSQTELIALEQALGRITAVPVVSPIDVPPFTNSAMDGYAIRINELHNNAVLPVAGTALAGAPFTDEWPDNTCVRIMTGAPLPSGANAVIMQEQIEQHEKGIRFPLPIRMNQNIRFAGEDISKHDEVLAAGIKLDIAQLPLLASLGIADLQVIRKLRVALFSTGDELQSVGQPLKAGQLYDTNRFTLRLMLERMGCSVIDLGIIGDDPAALRAAFQHADSQADVVISSGGVSVGEADYTKQILDQLGTVDFWKLAIKPGKPFAFGRLEHAWFCGLPGNPVSATVTFYQLVQPLLAKLAGDTQWHLPARLWARTLTPLKKSPGRLDFQRGMFAYDSSGNLEVQSTGHQGSHIFSSFSQGNCFIVLERERGAVMEGEMVEIEPFTPLLKNY